MELPTILPMKRDSEIDIDTIIKVGDDLDLEFRHQAGYYAWIATVYADAKAKTRTLKAEIELFEAVQTTQIREQFSGLTVGDVKAKIIINPKYQIKLKKLHESQHYEDIVQGFVRALDSKRDMLVQIGANSRQENDPEFRMMKKLRAKNLSR